MPLRATWGVLYFVFAEAAKALACDFEIACSMFTNVGTDTFNWNRASGRTPSTGTGPNAAAHGSYYMFIETSFPRVEGDFADLNASSLTLNGPTVLRFQYHMYGATMGKLQVLVNRTKFWERSGNQGNGWNTANVFLTQFATGAAVEVTFRGIRGQGWQSDLAIDNIKFEQALTSAALTPAPKPAPAPTLAPRLAPMPTPAPMPEPTPAPSLVLP